MKRVSFILKWPNSTFSTQSPHFPDAFTTSSVHTYVEITNWRPHMTTSANPGSKSVLERTRPRHKRSRAWLWFIPILLILGGAGWYFVLRPTESASTEATIPTTVTVSPEVYRETVSGTGTLSPARSVAATFEFDTSGTLASVVAVGTKSTQVMCLLKWTRLRSKAPCAMLRLAQKAQA